MIGTFPGKLSFADGDEVDVDLEIAAGRLKLVTGISEIGSWPLDVCSLAPDAADGFNLIVDGDRVRFSPDHPDAFTQFVEQLGSNGRSSAAVRPSTETGEVADEAPADPAEGREAPGAAASDEDIALTLEALFASAFTDAEAGVDQPSPAGAQTADSGAVGDRAGGRGPAASPDMLVPDAARGPVVDTAWSPPDVATGDRERSLEDAGDAVVTDGWAASSMEVEEWSPEATAAALEAELRGPPAPAEEPPVDDGPAGGEEPALPTPGHWRDYDPLEPSNGAGEAPPQAGTPTPMSEWPGEALRDLGLEEDHFVAPPRGYGDDAFEPAVDDDPWSAIPDSATTPDPAEDGTEEPVPVERGGEDRGWFRSSATERLASVADAIKERADAEDDEIHYSVADEVRASQQQLRSSGRHRDIGKLVRRVGIPLAVVAVLGGLAFFTPRMVELIAGRIDAAEEVAPELEAEDAGAESAGTAVPTAEAADETEEGVPAEDPAPVDTTAPPPETTVTTVRLLVFDLPSSEFVARWNDVGTSISPRFELPGDLGPELFSRGLTDYVGIEGRIGEGGTVDGFTVIVDPRGEPQDDQLGIQALGVAIGVVDPTTTGVERRDILMDLGLDVSDPELSGIDGRVTENGVDYRLVFDDDSFLLRFSLTPAGSSPPEPETTETTEATEATG